MATYDPSYYNPTLQGAGPGQSTSTPIAGAGGQDALFSSLPGMLSAIGGLTNAATQYYGGGINGTIDRNNANLDRLRASQAIQAGDLAGNRAETAGNVIAGRAAGSFAGQGVQSTGGTAGAVQTSTRASAAMNDLIDRTMGQRQAYGLDVQAASEQFQGDMAKKRGDEQATASLLSTVSQEALYSDPSYRSRWGNGGGYGGGGYGGRY